MPRKLRVQYPGAIYHVMSRENRRDNIFLDDVDRQDFLKTLAETCQKTSFEVHLLECMAGQLGDYHAGDLRRQSGEVRAERILAEELQRLGWTEADLQRQRKNAPDKLAMAARLRRETTLPVKWIAARVQLGTSKGANRNLHQWMKNHPVSAANLPSTPKESE